MWVRAIYTAYLKNNIEHKKSKTHLELTTSSCWKYLLSSTTVTQEIATTMTKRQYYYSWGLLNYFLSNFDCFIVSQYLLGEMILFCSRQIGLLVHNFWHTTAMTTDKRTDSQLLTYQGYDNWYHGYDNW